MQFPAQAVVQAGRGSPYVAQVLCTVRSGVFPGIIYIYTYTHRGGGGGGIFKVDVGFGGLYQKRVTSGVALDLRSRLRYP